MVLGFDGLNSFDDAVYFRVVFLRRTHRTSLRESSIASVLFGFASMRRHKRIWFNFLEV